jgi:hypothetical protein
MQVVAASIAAKRDRATRAGIIIWKFSLFYGVPLFGKLYFS